MFNGQAAKEWSGVNSKCITGKDSTEIQKRNTVETMQVNKTILLSRIIKQMHTPVVPRTTFTIQRGC